MDDARSAIYFDDIQLAMELSDLLNHQSVPADRTIYDPATQGISDHLLSKWYSASWDIVMHYESDDEVFPFPHPPSTAPVRLRQSSPSKKNHSVGQSSPEQLQQIPTRPFRPFRPRAQPLPKPPLGIFAQSAFADRIVPDPWKEVEDRKCLDRGREAAQAEAQDLYDSQRLPLPSIRERRSGNKRPSCQVITSPALAKRLGVPLSSSLLLDPTADIGRAGMDMSGHYL